MDSEIKEVKGYYLETVEKNGYYDWISKIVSAASPGEKFNEKIFLFTNENECDMAVLKINKLFAYNKNDIVKKAVYEKVIKEDKKEKVKENPAEAKRSLANKEKELLLKLLQKPIVPPPDLYENHTQNFKTIQLQEIINLTKQDQTKTSKATAVDEPDTVALDEIENIGSEQYVLDENIETFEVAPAN